MSRTGINKSENESSKPTRQQVAKKSLRYERQHRYREKQRVYATHLESTVKRLRMDVDDQLIDRHNARAAHIHTQQVTTPSQLCNMKTADVVAVMHRCIQALVSGVQAQQACFLESAMCSDVHYGDSIGREAILEQWTRFTVYFDGAAPVLEHCGYNLGFLSQDAATGCVRSILAVRLTHSSLSTLFPRAFTNRRVRDKLLQSSIVQLPMLIFFQFDEQGKVCRYEPTIDFVTGLYAVLGNCSDVSITLEAANINTYGQISTELPAKSAVDPCDDRDSPLHHNKFSVAFLLSNGEDVRRADRQAAS